MLLRRRRSLAALLAENAVLRAEAAALRAERAALFDRMGELVVATAQAGAVGREFDLSVARGLSDPADRPAFEAAYGRDIEGARRALDPHYPRS
jgi:hypothetical protein